MASKLKVGVNYPWKNYGWDFGKGPYSYSEVKWKKAVQEDLTQLKNLGIFAVRWFILADGLTYGTGTKHAPHLDKDPNRKGEWRFDDPPKLYDQGSGTKYAQIVTDFLWLLELMTELDLKLLPSLIDFHWCRPGKQVKPGFVKGGRYDILNDGSKRMKFWDRLFIPLLKLSKQYKDTIYAWELINEPEWVTRTESNYDPEKKTVSLDNMISFIREGVGRINHFGFKSTVGMAHYETIMDKEKWMYNTLGITLHQYHYYPKLCPASEAKPLVLHTFSPKYPCIIGEIATATDCPYYFWPELNKEDQVMYNRLKLIDCKNYPAVFLWSMNGSGHATNWELNIEEIKQFIGS